MYIIITLMIYCWFPILQSESWCTNLFVMRNTNLFLGCSVFRVLNKIKIFFFYKKAIFCVKSQCSASDWCMTTHTEKNRGAAHFAARGLHVGNGVGCPWAAHGNFAMQTRQPTTSIYGNSGQLSGQRSGLPMGCPWEICHANKAAPLLSYTNIVGSSVCNSVGSPLLSSMDIVGSSVGSPLNCPLKMEAIFDSHARNL